MNFYQNQIWQVISKEIFNKELFNIYIFGKKYWGVKKTHKKFGLRFSWYQVLGITIPENISLENFKKELNSIKNKYNKFQDVFFQFGFINQLQKPYFENRKKIENSLLDLYKLKPSIKENMPCATVQVDLQQTEEELYSKFSKSAKRNIRKAIKENIVFSPANEHDIINFYRLWEKTAKLKGFYIYGEREYLKLISFLRNTQSGDLYVVKKDNIIISGSIEINEKEKSYYLYGATNRDYIKLGGHYFLKYEMFKHLKKKGIKKVDLLGVAPEGVENHHLSGVSQFKHSLGGEHIEYYGNYDLPLNNFLYNIIAKLKGKM